MKINVKIISYLLVVVMLLVELSSCFVDSETDSLKDTTKESIIDDVVDSILGNVESSREEKTENDLTDNEQESENINSAPAYLDYEYYTNNTETNVYSLLKNELSVFYHAFFAKIILSDGQEILGIAFTDYSNPYVNEELESIYYPTGFISAVDELAIPLSEYELGLEIIDIEGDETSEWNYILTHTLDSFSRHSVFLNKYVKYGVTDEGIIWFEESDYVKGFCDESLGALFSYDENRFVFDPNVGEYSVITGDSLTQCIDYRALEAEVNRIIREQDYNFSSVEVNNAITFSQIALINYLLSMSEETFMGYNVSDLISIANELDPSMCLETTPSGLIVVNIAEIPPEEPTEFVKWMTGICCGVAIVGGIALSVLGTQPQFIALKGVGGAIVGASIEIAIEVIVENKALSEVDYRKVVIAAVAGAISAYLGIFADAVVGGIVESVFTLMDGGSLGDAADSFVIGMVSGLVLAGALNLAALGVSKIVQKAAPILKKVLTSAEDIIMKKFGVKGDDFTKLGDFIAHMRSKRLAKKWGGYVINEDFFDALPENDFLKTLTKKSPKFTSEAYDVLDVDGITKLTKEQYENVIRKSGNFVLELKGKTLEIAQARYGKQITSIRYSAGQPQLPNFGEVMVDITSNRSLNFSALDEAYAKGVREGTITLSGEIEKYFAKKGIDPSTVTKAQITTMRKGTELSLTWHEIYDPILGIKGVLVDTALHSKLPHVGGRKEAEILASVVSYVNKYLSDYIGAT